MPLTRFSFLKSTWLALQIPTTSVAHSQVVSSESVLQSHHRYWTCFKFELGLSGNDTTVHRPREELRTTLSCSEANDLFGLDSNHDYMNSGMELNEGAEMEPG